jgi:predicted Zn-dependent protease
MKRICDLGHVDLDYPLEVTVLKSPQINAFATAGSFVFIYTGLLERLTDVSEIMGVLCHELTHTWEHHIRRQIDLQNDMNTQKTLLLATLPLIVMFPGAGELIYGMAIDQTIVKQLSFSQQMEYEADAGALKLMMASGFETIKLTTAFENIGRYQSIEGAPSFVSYYGTHPLTRHRIDRIKYHHKNIGMNVQSRSHINRAQWDYTLLLSELESEYQKNTALIGDRLVIASYKDCIAKNDYTHLFEVYPDSLVLRMRTWNALRTNGQWEAFAELDQHYTSDPYWEDLPIVIEGRAERDLYTMTSRDFIRKHQKTLLDPHASRRVVKYLAQAYCQSGQDAYFHLAQSKYFLLGGDYQGALKELRSDSIDPDCFYAREIRKEAELKWETFRELT